MMMFSMGWHTCMPSLECLFVFSLDCHRKARYLMPTVSNLTRTCSYTTFSWMMRKISKGKRLVMVNHRGSFITSLMRTCLFTIQYCDPYYYKTVIRIYNKNSFNGTILHVRKHIFETQKDNKTYVYVPPVPYTQTLSLSHTFSLFLCLPISLNVVVSRGIKIQSG